MTFNLSNIVTATPILCILTDITAKIPAINIPVSPCVIPIGLIIDNTHEDIAIAVDIPTKAVTKANGLTLNLRKTAVAINIFSKCLDIAANIAAIRIPVSNCVNPIGIILFNIQDDRVIATDIITIVNDATNACLRVRSSLAIFSKATAIITIANPNPITDRKSILPTNLNAIPIAKTAIAISSIVPTPFFRLLSFFLSPPISSIGVFFSLDFFLDISKIVF